MIAVQSILRKGIGWQVLRKEPTPREHESSTLFCQLHICCSIIHHSGLTMGFPAQLCNLVILALDKYGSNTRISSELRVFLENSAFATQ